MITSGRTVAGANVAARFTGEHDIQPSLNLPEMAGYSPSRSVDYISGWWFGTFLFSHILGIIIPID